MSYCGKCGHLIEDDCNSCENCFTKILKEDDYYNVVLHSFNGIFVALVSKVAKVDGRICEKEANYISDLLTDISEYKTLPISNIRNIYKQIMNNEKDDFSNIDTLCQELIKLNVLEKERTNIVETLLELSLVDSDYNEDEEAMIIKIMHHLNLDFQEYQFLKDVAIYLNSNPDEKKYPNNKRIYLSENLKRVYNIEKWTITLSTAFKILESKENDLIEDIEKNYTRLLKQYEDDSKSTFSDMEQYEDDSKDAFSDIKQKVFLQQKKDNLSLAYERIKKYKNNFTITRGNCWDCNSTINYEDNFCTNCGIKYQSLRPKKIVKPRPLKNFLALSVVIAIIFISTFTHGILKMILQSSSFGLTMYEEYGRFGSILYTIIELSPLLIGIWLIRLSWKKITTNKKEDN